jgi:hypothetical protein
MQAIRTGGLSLFTALMLVGCGGGDGGGETSPQTSPPPVAGVNAAPTIQGQPGTSIVAGEAYSFQATASDANGDTLTFSAANLPTWLSLNASTGRLTGTPSAADVGSYDGVRLSVSDGQATASLAAFTITVAAVGEGSATLSWVAPTQNTDGSSLMDLTGFTIRYGRSATELTESVAITNPSISSYVLENLGSGAWYFAVVAVNSTGSESALSNVASKTIA